MSCLIGFHSVFSTDMVSIIMATNLGESKEFISTYFSLKVLILWAAASLLVIISIKKKSLLNRIGTPVAKVLVPAIGICVLYLGIKGTKSYNPKFYDFVSFEAPPDLHPYQELNKYKCGLDNSPEYIVMIIGESFSKYHSSLYGYDKETNPKLGGEKSLLKVYEDVVSPALNTIEAFKRIMSTYSDELSDSLA